jgi:accessory colonization factor AcfC
VTVALALLLLSLAGCDKSASDADDLKEWFKWTEANPPVSDATWRDAGVLLCRAEKVNVCRRSNGCSEQEAVVFSRWTPAKGTYERCDTDDRVEATAHR